MTENLEQLRKEITTIDHEMADLFVERMLLIKQIGLYKKEYNLAIHLPQREAEMFEHYLSWIKHKDLKDYYSYFLENIIAVSRNYQNHLLKK